MAETDWMLPKPGEDTRPLVMQYGFSTDAKGRQVVDIGSGGPPARLTSFDMEAARVAQCNLYITGGPRGLIIPPNTVKRGDWLTVGGQVSADCHDGGVQLTLDSPSGAVSTIHDVGTLQLQGRSRAEADFGGFRTGAGSVKAPSSVAIILLDESSAFIRGGFVPDDEGRMRDIQAIASHDAVLTAADLPDIRFEQRARGVLFGSSRARALDSSTVQAFDRTAVKAFSHSTVVPADDAHVEAYDHASVRTAPVPEGTDGLIVDGSYVPEGLRDAGRHRPCRRDGIRLHDWATEDAGVGARTGGASTASRILAEAPAADGNGPQGPSR